MISRADYADRLHGFWLGQCIANWTGLVTEMDKIGGEGPHGKFYTREDWGKPDQPSIWGQGVPSDLSATIDFVFEDPDGVWGADDDTDIEYLYQHLLHTHQTSVLSGEQIRAGWDADNPAATWGGLLGFMSGRAGVERAFDRTFSSRFNIHRTRGGFPNGGLDDFDAMAWRGVKIVDRVVQEEMHGGVDLQRNVWLIPGAAGFSDGAAPDQSE